jgi:predicted ATP-dependent serine protease
MIYYQGTWYCAQCGDEYETFINQCKLCKNDEFQVEPLAPIDDFDQLSDKDIALYNFAIGNF